MLKNSTSQTVKYFGGDLFVNVERVLDSKVAVSLARSAAGVVTPPSDGNCVLESFLKPVAIGNTVSLWGEQ